MPEEKKQLAWHHIPTEEVLENLRVTEKGLSEADALERISEYGLNRLPKQKPRSWSAILVAQFFNPMMVALILAVLVSAWLAEWVDLFVILVAVFVNVLLGFVEEYKADRSLQKLNEFLPYEVRVKRDGIARTIEAHEIVPGDILLVSRGDKVPADARIIHSRSLEMNESALTGESSAVSKTSSPVELHVVASDQENMIFAGTVVLSGDAEAVVVGTGAYTEIGRISHMVSSVDDAPTPLQQQMNILAQVFGAIVIVLSSAVFLIGILHGQSVHEMLRISVALGVAAIPEGLVISLTVILAVGMQRILKRDALVRRLVASETLGSVSVICVDKTGTLTLGRMKVVELNIKGDRFNGLYKASFADAFLALWKTNATTASRNAMGEAEISGSSTEIAIMQYLRSYLDDLSKINVEVVSLLPFNSTLKYAAAIVRVNGKRMIYAVGAPEILLDLCDISDDERRMQQAILDDMIARGQRVLFAAGVEYYGNSTELRSNEVRDLLPLAFIGLQDAIRENVKEVIAAAKGAGLRSVMITGDHPKTASVVATKLGLLTEGRKMLTGAELDQLSDQDLTRQIDLIDVYARVLPKQKVRIVRAWQARGHSVAMTGDGVNDAPAIKAADIGIAIGSGTEVAKETADMVLLKNDFSVIVAAIREGRIIFDNIRKVIVYLFSGSFTEIILVGGALIFSLPLPLLPAHILWINVLTDGFPSIALTFEPGEAGIMDEPPRKKTVSILNRDMQILILITAFVSVSLLFVVYFYLLRQGFPIDKIRTLMFISLGFNSLVYIFSVRKFRTNAFTSDPFDNPWLTAAVFAGLVLQVFPVVFLPLRRLFELSPVSSVEWLLLGTLAALNLIIIELLKSILRWRRRR